MNNQGWDKLLCSYFYVVCLSVLAKYFSTSGFFPDKTNTGGVTFRKNDIFVEIDYEPETYPNYVPTIVIGIGTGAYDDRGKFTGVPIWSVIPEGGIGGEFSTWTFSNENELSIALSKIKTMILENYTKPLWKDRDKLEEEIKKFVAR